MKKTTKANKGFIQGFQLGFFVFTTLMAGISQLPTVKSDFRVKKAVELCETLGNTLCQQTVNDFSKEELLAYIRDDESSSYPQWSDMRPRLGSPSY